MDEKRQSIRHRMRPFWTITILTTLALAGCLSEDPGDADNDNDEGSTTPPAPENATDDDLPPPGPVSTPPSGSFEDFLGIRPGDWFFAEPTGNCCENYVTVTPTGRILDFGGTYIQYSDDNGATWTTVDDTLIPHLSGEGAITVAPGGDVVGIGWDPYTGDQAYSFLYDVEADTWQSALVPVHTPVWDRQWIVALQGPFTIDGEDVPYVVFARGGTAYKDVLLMSTDGLTYDRVSLPAVETWSNAPTALAAIDTGIHPWMDWTQPLKSTTISSIGPGMALQKFGSTTYLFDSDGRWSILELSESSLPEGALVTDSAGSLHVVAFHEDETAFDYSVSHDGGRSWSNGSWELPEGMTVFEWDFKAHAALDQTIVAVRAETAEGTAQDLVFRFRGLDADPWLQEVLLAGDGQSVLGGGGASNTDGERYDFMSTALRPDGRLVFSIMDSTTPDPVLAFEL